MIKTINTSNSVPIDWGASGEKEIFQNVSTILKTMKYEVAYDRTLGVNKSFQDRPANEAIPLAISQIYDQLNKREPRVNVKDVSFSGIDDSGNLSFEVVIEV